MIRIYILSSSSVFLSTPSAGRATEFDVDDESYKAIFLSTPSARRATPKAQAVRSKDGGFLSTPSARRATVVGGQVELRGQISIHALREEGDQEITCPSPRKADFYPRPPRGGRPRPASQWTRYGNFYPRPPRGGRPSPRSNHGAQNMISIHALREEGDWICARTPVRGSGFLSTPSARRATAVSCLEAQAAGNFYPRPPRGGRRTSTRSTPISTSYFYPRPPRGGRLHHRNGHFVHLQFLSTPSARRATSA